MLLVALCLPALPPPTQRDRTFSRRLAIAVLPLPVPVALAGDAIAASPPLRYTSASSGLQWVDLRQGSGNAPRRGDEVSVHYIMTRRGGAKVHSTREAGEPFSWTLGDGSVIEGLELAVGGGGGLPPMLVGGARRVIVPMALGYGSQTGGPSRAKEAQQDRLWATDVRDLRPVRAVAFPRAPLVPPRLAAHPPPVAFATGHMACPRCSRRPERERTPHALTHRRVLVPPGDPSRATALRTPLGAARV